MDIVSGHSDVLDIASDVDDLAAQFLHLCGEVVEMKVARKLSRRGELV
jgi:hypothetical protein